MTDEGDAKVIPLFQQQPNLGDLPVQQGLVEMLERLAQEAACGRITGLAVVAFMGGEQFKCGTAGRMRYTAALGGLEDLKYQILKQGPSYT